MWWCVWTYIYRDGSNKGYIYSSCCGGFVFTPVLRQVLSGEINNSMLIMSF